MVSHPPIADRLRLGTYSIDRRHMMTSAMMANATVTETKRDDAAMDKTATPETVTPKTLNKVLIPLDDAEFSLAVLPHVTNLLAPDRNELFLLHVAPKPESIFVVDDIRVYADQQAESFREE